MTRIDTYFDEPGEVVVIDRIERQYEHDMDMLREMAERNLSRSFYYAERGLDALRILLRSNADCTEQLKEYQTTLSAFLIQVMALGANHG